MSKRSASTYTADDGFIEDAPKRAKKSLSSSASKSNGMPAKSSGFTSAAESTSGKSAPHRDENGDTYWQISNNGLRRVTLNQFKGKWMVNVREYYEAEGVKKPGKKGISLPLDQYAAFIEVLPGIEKLLRENGEDVPRPKYDGASRLSKEDSEGDEDADVNTHEKGGKGNHEATSEEDE